MTSFGFRSMALAALALAAFTVAQAQVVQYQYTPPPPIVPLQPYSASSYGGLGLAPPLPVDPGGHRALHHRSPHASRSVLTHHGRLAVVPPGRPGYNTFGDRVLRCQQAGSELGLNASQQGGFTARCAN
jgi:hypothetical protein